MPDLPTGAITIRFTAIEGSTARWELHREAMEVALARHDASPRAGIEPLVRSCWLPRIRHDAPDHVHIGTRGWHVMSLAIHASSVADLRGSGDARSTVAPCLYGVGRMVRTSRAAMVGKRGTLWG